MAVSRSYPWSPEIELLLACARRELGTRDVARATSATAAGIEWPRLVDLADAHGLLPLLSMHASRIDAPAAALDELKARALAIARRNLFLTGELLAILSACRDAGVAVVSLKGPELSERVYGSIAIRQYRDLDLLFRFRDLPVVAALLRERGYRVDTIPDARLAGHGRHVAAQSRDGRVHVELHYALLTPRGRAVQTLETLNLLPAVFQGVDLARLQPRDELLYLCEHGASHAWSRLEWIATVGELLRRDAAMPGGHEGAAVTTRLRAAEHLVGRLLDPPSRPAARGVVMASALVIRRLARDPWKVRAMPWDDFRYQFLTAPTWRARVHLSAMTLAQPAPHDMEGLPRWIARTPMRVIARPFALWRRWRPGRRRLSD